MSAVLRKVERQQIVSDEILEHIERMVADARAGIVTSILVVADYGPDQEIDRASSFDDRLRVLGALEYLKDSVFKG